MAAVGVANSAFKALKAGIEKGQELQDMAGVLSKFFEANEQISEANIENQEASNTAKLVAGKSIDQQAMEIALAKRRAASLEKELREFLIYSGQGDFYRDLQRQRRTIKQQRLAAARVAAKRKSDLIDLGVIIGAVALVSILIGVMVHLIQNYS